METLENRAQLSEKETQRIMKLHQQQMDEFESKSSSLLSIEGCGKYAIQGSSVHLRHTLEKNIYISGKKQSAVFFHLF